jgi:hypothetical protein
MQTIHQTIEELNAMADVFDGWNHNDAKQVLDAVAQARDGAITESEMVKKLEQITGFYFETGAPA